MDLPPRSVGLKSQHSLSSRLVPAPSTASGHGWHWKLLLIDWHWPHFFRANWCLVTSILAIVEHRQLRMCPGAILRVPDLTIKPWAGSRKTYPTLQVGLCVFVTCVLCSRISALKKSLSSQPPPPGLTKKSDCPGDCGLLCIVSWGFYIRNPMSAFPCTVDIWWMATFYSILYKGIYCAACHSYCFF